MLCPTLWVLGMQSQVLILVWKALYPTSHFCTPQIAIQIFFYHTIIQRYITLILTYLCIWYVAYLNVYVGVYMCACWWEPKVAFQDLFESLSLFETVSSELGVLIDLVRLAGQ